MQPPPPAYTTADAAARAHILAECGLHDAMTQHTLRSQGGRSPRPRTQSYSSLITPEATAAHPPAAPPKVEGMTVEEGPLRHHRYDMGIRYSKRWKKAKKKSKGPLTRLFYLVLITCLVAGLSLLIWGCKQKPRPGWAIITGTSMLCVFGAYIIFYIFVWAGCHEDAEIKKIKENQGVRCGRLVRLVLVYIAAVLASGIGSLVWGCKQRPEKVMWAVWAGAAILGAHGVFLAGLFVVKGGCTDEKEVEEEA